jgi:hypothetical protein
MRKILCVIPIVLLFVAIGAPNARAGSITDYTIHFHCFSSGGCLPQPAGVFVYDDSTNQFIQFSVMWDGDSFDLTSAANSPDITGGGPPCIGGATGPQATLALMTTCDSSEGTDWLGQLDGSGQPLFQIFTHDFFPGIDISEAVAGPPPANDAAGFVTSSVTSSATPEPDTFVLFGTGLVALAGVLRRKLTV